MNTIGNREVLTPIIRDIIQDETSGKSVIVPPEGGNTISNHDITGSSPIKEPESVMVGTGKGAAGYVFSTQPGAFIPAFVGGVNTQANTSPAPGKVRRASVTSTYFQGFAGETLCNTITWAPPLIDITGRWLEVVNNDPTGTQFMDLLAYYMVERENLLTGEVVTIGMVGHSAQVISSIRDYLTSEKAAGRNGVVTDHDTWRATFDSALLLPVLDRNGDPVLDEKNQPLKELIVPGGHEKFFQCQDTTAASNQSYRYMVRAITGGQLEGESVWVAPGSPTAAGGLDLDFSPAWCSTYPNIYAGDTTGGTGSYLDLTLTAGTMLSEVQVSLIPLMDNALNVDTSAPSMSDPFVVETNPIEAKLFTPTTGSALNTIEFIGRNFEACGGITAISGGVGIALEPGSITKTLISGADYRYSIKLRIQTGVPSGPRTLNFTTQNGKTCMASQFVVVAAEAPSTAGPVFTDYPNTNFYYTVGDPTTLTIFGSLMNSITGWTVTPTGKTTISIVSKSENAITLSFTPFLGGCMINPILTGATSSGKDAAWIQISSDKGGDDSDPTKYNNNGVTRKNFSLLQGA